MAGTKEEGEKHPRITVVIPTYNRAHVLPQAIQSVRAQRFTRWQLIIVDDGSTDSTAELVLEIPDERIRLIRTERKGAAEARNIGASDASAPYLTFLDSDDEVTTDWLERIVAAFDEDDADIVTTGFRVVQPDGSTKDVGLLSMGAIFDHIRANITHSGTWAVRTSIFFQIGGFAPGLPASQHTEVAFRLIPASVRSGWKIVGIDQPLVHYHASSSDGIRGDDSAVLAGAEFLISKHGSEMRRKDPERLARSHAVAGFRAARLNDRVRARRHFVAACRYGSLTPKAIARVALSFAWPLRPRSWRPQHPSAGTRGLA